MSKGVLTMDEKLEKLSDNVNDIKNLIHTFNRTLENIEHRLDRLEKVDSIEHRVAVNQIDLSDIKEALVRIEGVQSTIEKEVQAINQQENKEEIKYINRRLDSHLVKLAKAEEEIIMLKTK
jgi:chromosome segregation ATPase